MPEIRILTTEGEEHVPAELFGALALHVGVNGRRLYNITHVFTGKWILKDLSKRRALGLCERLRKLDWGSYDDSRKAQFEAAVLKEAGCKEATTGPARDPAGQASGGRVAPA